MTNCTYNAFILSFLAGISTVIGSIIILIKNNNKIINKVFSFSAGIMISISIMDLIPNSFKLISYGDLFIKILLILIFMVVGIIISMSIDKYLPPKYYQNNNKLYKIGLISMIAVILHNIPEGIITFITANNNIKLGIKLSVAIALHNIPEGIIIATPIYSATGSKKSAIIHCLIAGLSEIFGSIIAFIFIKNVINHSILSMLYASVAGIMIHIATYELLPQAQNNSVISVVIKDFLIGFIIMLIIICMM